MSCVGSAGSRGGARAPSCLHPPPTLGCPAPTRKELESGPWKSLHVFLASERAFSEAGDAAGVGVRVHRVGTVALWCLSHTARENVPRLPRKTGHPEGGTGLSLLTWGAWRGDTQGPGQQTSAPHGPLPRGAKVNKGPAPRAQHGPPAPRARTSLGTWSPRCPRGAGGLSPALIPEREGGAGHPHAHTHTHTAHSRVHTEPPPHTQLQVTAREGPGVSRHLVAPTPQKPGFAPSPAARECVARTGLSSTWQSVATHLGPRVRPDTALRGGEVATP